MGLVQYFDADKFTLFLKEQIAAGTSKNNTLLNLIIMFEHRNDRNNTYKLSEYLEILKVLVEVKKIEINIADNLRPLLFERSGSYFLDATWNIV